MKTDNLFAAFAFANFFLFLGYKFVFHGKKIVDALMVSSSVS